jgi:hypothetical protein
LARGSTEAAVGVDARVFTVPNLTGFAVIPSADLRIHLGIRARIDASVSVNITQAKSSRTSIEVVNPNGTVPEGTLGASSSANAVRLQIPISAIYNITDAVFIGLNSGVTVYDFNHVDNTTGIPAGITAGYTLEGASGPMLDIAPYFTFPYLVMPAAKSAVNTGEFVAGLSMTGFVYL